MAKYPPPPLTDPPGLARELEQLAAASGLSRTAMVRMQIDLAMMSLAFTRGERPVITAANPSAKPPSSRGDYETMLGERAPGDVPLLVAGTLEPLPARQVAELDKWRKRLYRTPVSREQIVRSFLTGTVGPQLARMAAAKAAGKPPG